MKFRGMQGLGARLETRFPFMWENRFRLAVFILLFLIFFVIHQQLLKLPETLRRMLNAFPLGHITYSDVAVHVFPPEVAIKDVALVNPARYDVVLRLDKLTIRPELLRLISGRASVRATALAGEGSATLDAATGGSFDVSSIFFTLDMENMPLRILGPLERFDPDIDGAVTAQVKGKVGMPMARECDIAANGRITLASARNDMAALTIERFRNGVLNFDLTVAGREAVIRRMDFTDQACSATVKGRMQVDWRNVPRSTLDLAAEIKTLPENITPALFMDSNTRQRLEQGQSMPIALKGTLGDVQMKPVF